MSSSLTPCSAARRDAPVPPCSSTAERPVRRAAPPRGGPAGNDKTNPEQLFAAGYAACFLNALKRVAKEQSADATGAEMTARVGLGTTGSDFGLVVTLVGSLPSLTPEQGHALMEAAHGVCPYSRATRGNVEVTLELA